MGQQLAITDRLWKLEKPFKSQNAYNLKFENECLFAKQQIMKSDFALKTAENSPESLKNAVLNVAAIGISLNPATAHAYLVPRDGQICLDISYRGLVKLATDAGAIQWAKSELVYEGDEFTYNGPCTPPTHGTDPFDKEHTFENVKGAYCIAKLASGDYMIETMSRAEIDKIKNTSKANNGPWKTWPEEMAKKSVTKRASKSWPPSDGKERIDNAIDILNQHEGLEEQQPRSLSDHVEASPEQKKQFHDLLDDGNELEFYVWWSQQDAAVQISLYNDFQQGEKTKGKQLVKSLEDKGRSVFEETITYIADNSEDDTAIQESLEGWSEDALAYIRESVDIEVAQRIEEVMGETQE